MAILPYAIHVQRSDTAQFNAIQAWCFTQWPHTHQATWYSREGDQLIISKRFMYTRTWYFQREADAALFALTWS